MEIKEKTQNGVNYGENDASKENGISSIPVLNDTTSKSQSQINIDIATRKSSGKRKTWLWVLGWLFIFPLPLTILLFRKKDMNPVLKYGIIAVAWAIYLLVAISGTGETQTEKTDTITDTETEQIENVKYADDSVVNSFIETYNEISESPFEDIKRGNIRTKYFSHSYGYYLELLDAADTGKIFVKIDETDETADVGVAGMKDLFRDVVKAMNMVNGCPATYSDDQINSYFDSMLAQNIYMENDTGLSVSVTFIPDTDSSRGHILIDSE